MEEEIKNDIGTDSQTRFLGIPKEEQSNHYLDLKFFSNRRSNVRRKDDRDKGVFV